MARRNASVSIPPDLAPYVDQYLSDGGNFSGLVCKLLRAHFTGGGDPKMTGVIGAELQGRISSLQDEITRLTADMERFKTVAEEAKAAEAEQAASLDATIRQIFSEIDEVGLTEWRRDVIGYNGNDAQFGHIVRVRCGLVASRAGLSESETAAAVLRLYPDLEAYL
jgi:uncharacterized small protein (DUF1192 family)